MQFNPSLHPLLYHNNDDGESWLVVFIYQTTNFDIIKCCIVYLLSLICCHDCGSVGIKVSNLILFELIANNKKYLRTPPVVTYAALITHNLQFDLQFWFYRLWCYVFVYVIEILNISSYGTCNFNTSLDFLLKIYLKMLFMFFTRCRKTYCKQMFENIAANILPVEHRGEPLKKIFTF